MRGYNLSSKPDSIKEYQVKYMVEDLRQLSEKLGYKKFTLVAHDWGGAIAWWFAITHPDYLDKLVIINAPHPAIFQRELAQNPEQQKASAYMTFFQTPQAEQSLSANNYKQLVEMVLGNDLKMRNFTEADKQPYLAAWSQPDRLTKMSEIFILKKSLKIRTMEVLTVKEAVQRVNSGGNLEGVVLDESTIKQVNVRDAMVLSRGGIVIPEQNIYYKDEEIEYDEDIDELIITSGIVKLSWEEKAKRAEEYSEKSKEGKAMIDLSTKEPEIDDWIAKNKKKLETLLKPIVINLFNAEKVIRE